MEQKCIEQLLSDFWVIRFENESLYFAIKEREKKLKNYFYEYFRFKLIVHPNFIRLEKIPAKPRPWMGIVDFKDGEDYSFLCYMLAFLDKKGTEYQFVLEELCEYITLNDNEIEWAEGKGYTNRLRLIRVLKYAMSIGIINIIDRDLENFRGDASYGVLFQTTVLLRYFMLPNNYDFNKINGLEDLEEQRFKEEENLLQIKIRNNLLRRLILEPVVHSDDLSEEEKEYLRTYSRYLHNHFSLFEDYRLEIYKNSLFVTQEQAKANKVFPNRTNVSILTIQLATIIREEIENGLLNPNKNGGITLTKEDFEMYVEEMKHRFQDGWSSKKRKEPVEDIVNELVEFLVEWDFAKINEEGHVVLTEVVGRVTGEYKKVGGNE